MATLADLKGMLLRILGDIDAVGGEVGGKTYSADLLKDAICYGLDAILPWVSKPSVASLAGNGSTTEFALPLDLYQIEGVWDASTKEFLEPAYIAPGRLWASPGAPARTWLEFPADKITIFGAPSSSGVQIYYGAFWSKPTADASAIEAPSITHLGILLFAASYCLLPRATTGATINQFKTKVDAGDPEDNPLALMSSYFYRRAESYMNAHPARVKGHR